MGLATNSMVIMLYRTKQHRFLVFNPSYLIPLDVFLSWHNILICEIY